MAEDRIVTDVLDGAWPAVLEVLARAGVRTLFGLPGDDVALVRALDACDRAGGDRPAPRLVLCADQRAAVLMAVGHALAGGGIGVVVVGKGPAVTNTATGLLEAAASAAPVLVVAGGTPGVRRHSGAFQEIDAVATMRPLTSWAARVEHAERLAPTLLRALRATTGPTPGPVLLELPDDLLDATIPLRPTLALAAERPGAPAAGDGAASTAVLAARRPLVLVGGGLRSAARGGAERLADALGAPLVVTASGRGAVDEDHPRFVGLAGLYAPPATRRLWDTTDCVIALGSRLEETCREGWPPAIGTTVPVVQVNTDPRGLSAEVDGPVVIGDAAAVAVGWADAAARRGDPDPAWSEAVTGVRARVLDDAARAAPAPAPGDRPTVREVLAAIAAETPADRVLVQENGLADMWSYHWPVWSCGSRGGSVVPSEQTPLGAGAAAAGGVKAAVGERTVVALVGDGALAMVDADLPSLVAAGLGVLYVVLDNGGYGWLQKQLGDAAGPAAPDGPFARPGRPSATHPLVDEQVVGTVAELRPALGRAWCATRRGEVALVRVPVALGDSPVAGQELAGDTPVPATEGHDRD